MWTKTSKKNWILALILALVTPCLTSCGSDDEPFVNNLDAPKYEALSGRYDITSASSPYEAVELFASGQYLIVKSNSGYSSVSSLISTFSRRAAATRAVNYNNMIFGNFTKIDNENFELEGFGRMQLRTSGQGAEITLQPNAGQQVTSSAKKVNVMPNDEKTNALCRTWKMVKLTEIGYNPSEGHYNLVSTGDDIEEGLLQTVTFSKSGTYMTSYQGNYFDAYFWKWEDLGAGVIRCSQDNMWYNGDEEGIATINFLEGGKISLYEYYKTSDEWCEITVELVEAK